MNTNRFIITIDFHGSIILDTARDFEIAESIANEYINNNAFVVITITDTKPQLGKPYKWIVDSIGRERVEVMKS